MAEYGAKQSKKNQELIKRLKAENAASATKKAKKAASKRRRKTTLELLKAAGRTATLRKPKK